MDWQVRQGIVTGRNHLIDMRNCQDALCHLSLEADGKPYLIGAIADGCGEGNHSESGAQLAVQFVTSTLRSIVLDGTMLDDIPETLFTRIVHFLSMLVDAYDFADIRERVKFVHDHLLFTLLGFLITPEQTIVFAAGDGVVLINDDRYLLQQNNTPGYIGYHLIDQQYLQATALSTGFGVYRVPSETLQRLAIGSDAWLQEQELLEHIWGFPNVAGLQLQMNRWSAARHLKDDASLVVVERAIHVQQEEANGR